MRQNFYKRKLPHWHPENRHLFITACLKGSVSQTALDQYNRIKEAEERLKEDDPEYTVNYRKRFAHFENALEKGNYGPTWLSDQRIAKLVLDAILYRNGKVYDLSCATVMSNHIHLLLKPILNTRSDLNSTSVAEILRSLKSYTGNQANKILGRSGAFWQHESYDHWIRSDASFHKTIAYIRNNPVKAGLVSCWEDWPFTWCKSGL